MMSVDGSEDYDYQIEVTDGTETSSSVSLIKVQRQIWWLIGLINPASDAHSCHMGIAIKHPVPDWVKPVICNFWHPGTLTLSLERQSARMSKITNGGLTRSGTGCFVATVGVKRLIWLFTHFLDAGWRGLLVHRRRRLQWLTTWRSTAMINRPHRHSPCLDYWRWLAAGQLQVMSPV